MPSQSSARVYSREFKEAAVQYRAPAEFEAGLRPEPLSALDAADPRRAERTR